MKLARLSLLFILAFCTLVFNSCKNEIVDFNTVNYLSATIDGQEEHSLIAAGLKSGSQLQIFGNLNGSEGISLTIKNAKVGTFDVVADGLLLSYSTESNTANTYFGLTGTVTITALSSTSASGTFEFIGTNSITSATKTITSGLFKCNVK